MNSMRVFAATSGSWSEIQASLGPTDANSNHSDVVGGGKFPRYGFEVAPPKGAALLPYGPSSLEADGPSVVANFRSSGAESHRSTGPMTGYRWMVRPSVSRWSRHDRLAFQPSIRFAFAHEIPEESTRSSVLSSILSP